MFYLQKLGLVTYFKIIILKLSLTTFIEVRYRTNIVFADGSGNYWGLFMLDIWRVRSFDTYDNYEKSRFTKKLNVVALCNYTSEGKWFYNTINEKPKTELYPSGFCVGNIYILDIKTIYPLKSYINCKNVQLKNHFTLRMIGFLFRENVKVFRFAKSIVSVFKSMVIYSFDFFPEQSHLNNKIKYGEIFRLLQLLLTLPRE